MEDKKSTPPPGQEVMGDKVSTPTPDQQAGWGSWIKAGLSVVASAFHEAEVPPPPGQQAEWGPDIKEGLGVVCSAFDKAGVDHVVWGSVMQLLYGGFHFPSSWDYHFIIPDEQLDQAAQVLNNIGAVHCHSLGCSESREYLKNEIDQRKSSCHPPPDIHMHKEDARPSAPHKRGAIIQLYKQSDYLWCVPSLKPDGVNILLVDHPSLCWGGFPGTPLMPARVLAPHRALEALLRLQARDADFDIGVMWTAWLLPLQDIPSTGKKPLRDRIAAEQLMEPPYQEYLKQIIEEGDAGQMERSNPFNIAYMGATRKLWLADPTLKRAPPPGHSFRVHRSVGNFESYLMERVD